MTMAAGFISQNFLFGGDKPWNPSDWTSSDDRVRGGSSISHLSINSDSPAVAEFNGTLDIKTLGGAGFASQRTIGEDRNWNLSSYDGIQLDVANSDDKQYTLILKDELLPKSPNGREQSTISWEYDFKAKQGGEKIFLTWDELNATYRGRKVADPAPLDVKNVRRISLMMRSFFGTQEGDFSMSIVSISAVISDSNKDNQRYRDDPSEEVARSSMDEKSQRPLAKPRQSWLDWLRNCLP